ncbi:MAG: IS110 family transposase [Tissierellia bacterium]|nr:IS110 family transposase [Tissierellia bacterium]
MKNDFLSTLFVGVDVSSKDNVFCALDYSGTVVFHSQKPNNQPGSNNIVALISNAMNELKLKFLVIALEATSFYSTHIANFLSCHEDLLPYGVLVYILNPKTTSSYRKSFVDMDKNDFLDAYVIADFARCGRITSSPWKGSQFLALQRLTRHRLHLIDSLTCEKNYVLSNIYLKFSELTRLKKEDKPFSNMFGASSKAVLSELSLDDIAYSSLEDLSSFLVDKGKNRFDDPSLNAKILKKAARDSYRLDKVLYEPINVSIASSFNVIKTLEKEIKAVDSGIEKAFLGLNPTEYKVLLSIPGIGPVYASGILSEIGTISNFENNDKLAKYAGITWRETQSGSFSSDNTRMTKTGNKYLRYYLIEATSSVIRHVPTFNSYYQKKYDESSTHQHKRALALTTRKFIRMIFGKLKQKSTLFRRKSRIEQFNPF